MKFLLSPKSRRAMLLGLPLALGACDVVSFISDPKPILEQTWSIPADTAKISVADMLPNGITIYSTPGTSDSSAFQIAFGTIPPISRVLAPDCAACVPLNGTTAIKPSFTLVTGTTTALPTNTVSASLLGGQVTISITNGFTFDPLRVKTIAPALTDPNQQGRMLIVVRNGSLVLGRDSINGATTAFAPGATLNRQINLQTGNITTALAVDLTITSPVSDVAVPINSNALLTGSASISNFRVAQARVNVVNKAMSTIAGDSIPLDGFGTGVTKYIVGGGFDVTISNPFNVTGNVSVDFGYAPGQAISKTLNITSGAGVQQIVALTSTDMETLFDSPNKIALSVSGSVNSAGPIDVTPKQQIVLVNRLIITVRTPE